MTESGPGLEGPVSYNNGLRPRRVAVRCCFWCAYTRMHRAPMPVAEARCSV